MYWFSYWGSNRQKQKKKDKIMNALNISEYDYKAIDNELKKIISDKGEIKSIKRYREITGVGLKEAK